MSDSDRSEQWPPRWEPPPPLAPQAAPGPPMSPPADRPVAGPTDPLTTDPPPPHPPGSADPFATDPPPPHPPGSADPFATYLPPPDLPRPFGPAAPPGEFTAPPSGLPPVAGGGPSNAARTAVITIATAVATAAFVLLIVQPWSDTAASGTAAPAPVPVRPVPTAQPAQAPVVAQATDDPGEALRAQADRDRSAIAAVPDGDWVPQLSSKRVGLVADGISYSEETIWADHHDLRVRFPDAALLWSGGYATFSGRDFWVTVVPSVASGSPETANAWCDQQNLGPDDCFAKRIGTSSYDRTTKHR